MAKQNPSRRNLVWDKILAKGENEYDFCAQTANGSARAGNSPGWNKLKPYTGPETAAEGVWAKGNRTAE